MTGYGGWGLALGYWLYIALIVLIPCLIIYIIRRTWRKHKKHKK